MSETQTILLCFIPLLIAYILVFIDMLIIEIGKRKKDKNKKGGGKKK